MVVRESKNAGGYVLWGIRGTFVYGEALVDWQDYESAIMEH